MSITVDGGQIDDFQLGIWVLEQTKACCLTEQSRESFKGSLKLVEYTEVTMLGESVSEYPGVSTAKKTKKPRLVQ